MRTFIALEPPSALRSAVRELNAALESCLTGMKWVKPDLIHLTLRFLGEIDPGRIDLLNRAVEAAAAEVTPFGLEVTGIGHFGSRRNPRVLWLGLEGNSRMNLLAAGLEKHLVAAGFGRADKPFRAHLTLARAGKKPGPPPDWDAASLAVPSGWPHWSVSQVSVIKSTLTPRGPIYEKLSTHDFKS